jgi:branched-chain amino acid transport system substrate-binding protein
LTKDIKTKTRREFMKTAAAGSVVAATGIAGFPHIAKAAAPVKIGVIHPVTGWAQYSGSQCRFGAMTALEEINAAGGIKSLNGAKLEALLGDAQSKPEVGAAEVDKMNEAGVSSIMGAYASNICLATTQAAAKYGIPHVVDVGVSDKIVSRGLTNTFRFKPGFGTYTKVGIETFIAINRAAGSPTKRIALVHENTTGFGAGMAKLVTEGLKPEGIEVVEVLAHPTPNKDFRNIALKLKEVDPDVIIPSHYYSDGVLFLRTLMRQKFRPKAIYSILGGASSQYRFVKEFPEAAKYVLDCTDWVDPKKQSAIDLRKKTEAAGKHFNYEVFLGYLAMQFTAASIEQAGSTDHEKITEAMATSTWDGHHMPYGPTKMVNGQNQGAQPVGTQILNNEIEVISPKEFATAKAVFPRPS